MKRISRRVMDILSWVAEASVSIACWCPALALGRWPSIGYGKPKRIFARRGFHLLHKHFYLPIPDEKDFGEGFFDRLSEMPGVDLNDAIARSFLKTVVPRYLAEFREQVPLFPPREGTGFHLLNGTYMAVDAHVYYALIRHGKPRRIVEVGGGNSSLLAGMACERNREEGHAAELIVVEPYPGDMLRRGFPGMSRLVEAKVQDVGIDLFAALESGDILFIDSSHVLRMGGDVQYEYLEIIPRLKPGVLIHVHDISLPKEYPRVYLEGGMYWNEQYLLQAFLVFNSRFEVIWPGNHMMVRYPDEVCSAFPEYSEMRKLYPQSEPTGFWMRVRE